MLDWTVLPDLNNSDPFPILHSIKIAECDPDRKLSDDWERYFRFITNKLSFPDVSFLQPTEMIDNSLITVITESAMRAMSKTLSIANRRTVPWWSKDC